MGVIGRTLRYVNKKSPIKLNLSGLVTRANMDLLVSGLKNNQLVYDINISNCELGDQELLMLIERLKND